MEKEKIKINLSQSSTNASLRWKKRNIENVIVSNERFDKIYIGEQECLACNNL
jgi:fructose-1-phosphate kinase PfkB-like protein